MATFTDFLATLDADPRKRGRQFEHFVKWFLKNDPRWATQVEEVWLWSDYPNNWGRDKGIDLVFKDRLGRLWAVQAKCYSPDYEITKADVDTFLSESNRKHIDHRLLIATTDRLGTNGKEVLDGQEKPVVRFHLNDFESAAVEYPDTIERLAAAKPRSKPSPRPHQIEAVNNIASGFESSNRGQVIMACGTGKTFVCLWAKERLKAKRTLVLLPSLGLLSQTLSEWTYAAQDQFDALCVCSDRTVGRQETDEAVGSISELPFPVTSDTAEIARFLKADRPQVIFSTYQSSPLIAAVQADDCIPSFDLIIADEAHRCAGKTDTAFYTPLDDGKIRAEKRLFATATPRVYRTSLKKSAEDFGVEVADMNDERIFGRRFHTLSFGEAIRQELLTDYRVLIVGVDNTMVAEWIKTRRLVSTETGHDTDAETLAAQIALLKSIKDWDLHRVISFHGRVKRAKDFSEDIVRVSAWLDVKHRPSGTLWSDYVSGEMPTIARKRKLQRLRAVGSGEIGLLSNARCLSEGVDVPALDGVAFIDPRGSEIDIIQSVGRAIRLSKSKTMGTVVIPVFIEQPDDAIAAIESSHFKSIWDVLEALKSHDERLSDELDQLRVELGAKRKRTVNANDLTKIVFDLPTSVKESFAESLRVHLVEQTTASWLFWYGLLEQYTQTYGDSRVPSRHETERGLRLGQWVSDQRKRRRELDRDRLNRLEALPGWSWNVFDDAWEDGFAQLEAFVKREGHSRVKKRYTTVDGFPLGSWVGVQRSQKERMDEGRRQRLESLPKWSWEVHLDNWDEGKRHLIEFRLFHGHCRVPTKHVTSDGFKLGYWVSQTRENETQLSRQRKHELDELGFEWTPVDADWENSFKRLEAYQTHYRHCNVPSSYITDDGFRLGIWVGRQRLVRRTMSAERRKRLEELGFNWSLAESRWDRAFDQLVAFQMNHGHTRVPVDYCVGDFCLGEWVRTQRKRKQLSGDERSKLESIGFEWNVFDHQWMRGLHHLSVFKNENGHTRVQSGFQTADGFNLGKWVSRQRQQYQSLSTERRALLDALGFELSSLDSGWDDGFRRLSQFQRSHGHCLVPARLYLEDGFKLGGWVAQQRKCRSSLDDRKKRLLHEIGFVWSPFDVKWEEGYSRLERFFRANGHCNVPVKHQDDDGYNLGNWVHTQRRTIARIPAARRDRLDRLGFVWKRG